MNIDANYINANYRNIYSLYYNRESRSAHFMNPFGTTYHHLLKAFNADETASCSGSPLVFSTTRIHVRSYAGRDSFSISPKIHDISQTNIKNISTIVFAARDILFKSYLENATLSALSCIGWILPVMFCQATLQLVGNICLGVEQIFYGMSAAQDYQEGGESILYGSMLLTGAALFTVSLAYSPPVVGTIWAIYTAIISSYRSVQNNQVSISSAITYYRDQFILDQFSNYYKQTVDNP